MGMSLAMFLGMMAGNLIALAFVDRVVISLDVDAEDQRVRSGRVRAIFRTSGVEVVDSTFEISATRFGLGRLPDLQAEIITRISKHYYDYLERTQ